MPPLHAYTRNMTLTMIIRIAVATNFLWFQSSVAQTTRSPQDVTCTGYCSNQATAPTGTPPNDLGTPAPYTAYVDACTDQLCCCDITLGCAYVGQQVTCDPGFFFDPNTAAPGYTCRPVSEMNQVAQCCATNFTAGCPSTTTQRITTRVTSPTTTLVSLSRITHFTKLKHTLPFLVASKPPQRRKMSHATVTAPTRVLLQLDCRRLTSVLLLLTLLSSTAVQTNSAAVTPLSAVSTLVSR